MANIIDNLDENVKYLIFFLIVIIIFIFQKVLQSIVKRAATRERIPPDVVCSLSSRSTTTRSPRGIRVDLAFPALLAAAAILGSSIVRLKGKVETILQE